MSELDGIHGYCASCKHFSRDGERASWGTCQNRAEPAGWIDGDWEGLDAHFHTGEGETCAEWEVGEAQMTEALERSRRALFIEMGDYANE